MIEQHGAQPTVALRLSDVTKAFGRTVALDGVSVQIERGGSHAILGENGAGKSTLVRIVAGALRPDRGSLEVFGNGVTLGSPRDARRHRIATAFQELSLVPELTVAQNLFLGHEPTGPGPIVMPRDLRHRAEQFLTSMEMEALSPDRLVRDLRLADKQMLEIAKALRDDPAIVLLDEPTSALGQNGMEWFYKVVSNLRSKGVTIVFITHRLAEITAVCKTVTILRNGRVAGTHEVGALSESEIIRLMIGRSLQATFPARRPASQRPIVLETRGLTVGSALTDAGLQLRKGEILGVAGLAGHGHLELFLALFGMAKPDSGQILVDDRPVQINHPRQAVSAGIGISLVPEDRKTQGLFLRLPVRMNMAIPSLGSLARFGWIDEAALSRAVVKAADRVNLAHEGRDSEVSTLSGGNQQKVVIGKWVLAGTKILLLYDPTRGVDIGTKAEIYRLMQTLANEGVSILFYSTDLSEVTQLADRLLVFYRAAIVAELEGDAISDEAVMAAALGRSVVH